MIVVVGFTEVLPLDATLPTLWSIVTLVASVTLQLKVELSPTVMDGGSAKKELMIGAVGVGPHPATNIKTIIAKNKLGNLK